MEQNQPTEENQVLDQATNNDLQKAIDDITNTTNVDPVFSDPVAAPSSIPEGDTGELGEPVGPFPEPKVEIPAPAPEPMAPLDPVNLPDLGTPAPAPMPGVMPNTPIEPPMPETPAPEPIPASAPDPMPSISTENLNMHQVKEAALRDLVPLLDRLDMSPSQKFNLYRNIFEDLKDYTVLERAYRAASEIPDETERAEALLYLVESIDKM
ncbi:hypothetical protein IJH01_01770 [Candidatus Saccharibacteria bacterium]|nr:hypothetical protein [Candidatus Saccharibacteria bacterium]